MLPNISTGILGDRRGMSCTNRENNVTVRALVYVTKLRSDVFSLQETTPQMAQQFATVLSEFHGIHYKYFWNQRNRSGKDGCGTIYNSDLLSVEETKTFHYPGYTHIYFAHKFSIKNSNIVFWNVNTHVNWNSRNEDLAILKEEWATLMPPRAMVGINDLLMIPFWTSREGTSKVKMKMPFLSTVEKKRNGSIGSYRGD
eukprot:TRINITY_DN858_c0_g1_i4.p1 TRINITY_DN858_c0_g1~~TRINITY_DN858_c0_g1_i4.p1  ORF type:complete len:199 (+),score=25.60 TRINITY_DN858_c0_g1_i4:213-809(+)